MLQKNSFFSQGFIFFGPQQFLEEEDFTEDESDTAIPIHLSLDTDFSASQGVQIGLYIDWSSSEETD